MRRRSNYKLARQQHDPALQSKRKSFQRPHHHFFRAPAQRAEASCVASLLAPPRSLASMGCQPIYPLCFGGSGGLNAISDKAPPFQISRCLAGSVFGTTKTEALASAARERRTFPLLKFLITDFTYSMRGPARKSALQPTILVYMRNQISIVCAIDTTLCTQHIYIYIYI